MHFKLMSQKWGIICIKWDGKLLADQQPDCLSKLEQKGLSAFVTRERHTTGHSENKKIYTVKQFLNYSAKIYLVWRLRKPQHMNMHSQPMLEFIHIFSCNTYRNMKINHLAGSVGGCYDILCAANFLAIVEKEYIKTYITLDKINIHRSSYPIIDLSHFTLNAHKPNTGWPLTFHLMCPEHKKSVSNLVKRKNRYTNTQLSKACSTQQDYHDPT